MNLSLLAPFIVACMMTVQVLSCRYLKPQLMTSCWDTAANASKSLVDACSLAARLFAILKQYEGMEGELHQTRVTPDAPTRPNSTVKKTK